MKVKLRVLQGKLKNQLGGAQVDVRGPRFLIGSGDDCHMRIQSRLVSGRHCELLLEGDCLHVRDLGSESGTYVNEHRIAHQTRLSNDDVLRVGRLHFQVQFEQHAAQADDLMADYVSDMLVEADQEERARRMEDPRMRQFRVEPTTASGGSSGEPAGEPQQRPAKRAPAKLPPPPKYVADTSVEAAQETLKKIFERPKRAR